ncbi:MAG: GNAT family N-acetyltransferase [Prevotella sp.]|nr:GNAT family N-acetyltransferase [Candidatus Prevotella equi]
MIKLTALEPEDLELLYTIENDTSLWIVSNSNVHFSRYALRDYIVNQKADIYADKQLRLVVRKGNNAYSSDASDTIGLIDLFNFEPKHLRAELGIAILKHEQGKGYAQNAVQKLIDYCRITLHLHQIYCIVPINNEPSINMLRKVGFSNETILKDWILTSEGWIDAIQLQYFL